MIKEGYDWWNVPYDSVHVFFITTWFAVPYVHSFEFVTVKVQDTVSKVQNLSSHILSRSKFCDLLTVWSPYDTIPSDLLNSWVNLHYSSRLLHPLSARYDLHTSVYLTIY
jgi:hypothetical protein